MRVGNFYSLRRDGLQVAVLARWVLANAAVEYGFGKMNLVALARLLALGVYD